jgi:NAD(P)-dependent dehydrogenase (short-subunit alcohol dehydrogenase family)
LNHKLTLGLEGQVAIVTGGSRGIGRAIARSLLDAGCHVAICGRKPPLEEFGAEFDTCDVRQADQARALVDAVAGRHGRLDIVVNNAGGSPHADAAAASPRFSEAIIALNLLGPLYVAQTANLWMRKQENGGVIVNIASISGIRPSPGTAAYGAAKAGLLHLTRSLAQEWGPKVRVNAIVAGLMATETAATTYGSPQAQAEIAQSIPLKRMGRGDDVANAVLFLASPLAAYITGAQIGVDGGGERPPFLEIVERHATPKND